MKRNILIALAFLLLGLTAVYVFWEKPLEPKMIIREASFKKLPGWKTSHFRTSLSAFKVSCKAFLKQNPEKEVGSQEISVQVKDWLPACREAMELDKVSHSKAKAFFQKWFQPVEFHQQEPIEGLFTGYYSPLLKGSLKRSKKYPVPLYNLPDNLVTAQLGEFDQELQYRRIIGRVHQKKLIPYHERKAINQGAIKDRAEVIVWVDDPIDRQFLEIQGSGIVALENGERMYVGYAGQNGQPYTSLAKILIDKGVMTRDNASMQGIKKYLETHPEEKKEILNQNKSFVFFRKLDQKEAFGAQGVALTAGYSLAVDRKYVPLGTPIWLNTTSPGERSDTENVFQRLMIAQDTGGAIKGPVRGDVYWGAGKKATFVAGHMKNKGHYWLLLPKKVAAQYMTGS